jgi:hypothetical protein
MVSSGFLGITGRNEVFSENFLAKTLFLLVISEGNLKEPILLHVFLQGAFF